MPYGSGVMEINEFLLFIHLSHDLFIFTWLHVVNVPKFIVNNRIKGSSPAT